MMTFHFAESGYNLLFSSEIAQISPVLKTDFSLANIAWIPESQKELESVAILNSRWRGCVTVEPNMGMTVHTGA